MLDVFFREDLENVLSAVQKMGGDLFTLNAVRLACGLDEKGIGAMNTNAQVWDNPRGPAQLILPQLARGQNDAKTGH